ncbi:lachesin [Trichonephila clavipes]|nr:lachesin [Trichonephila clavipes]
MIEDTVDCVRDSFCRSPDMSIRQATFPQHQSLGSEFIKDSTEDSTVSKWKRPVMTDGAYRMKEHINTVEDEKDSNEKDSPQLRKEIDEEHVVFKEKKKCLEFESRGRFLVISRVVGIECGKDEKSGNETSCYFLSGPGEGDEAHFWLNGYVNKQNCRIWSEANPQVYVETPLHPEKLTVWCALWAGGILLQKR